MPDPNTIEVSISARTGEYVAAMKEAASTTGTTATAIQSELQGISSSASEAHAPMGAFTNIIKDYRTEVRTEGRYSRFLAGDIASMGIASKSAAGEVTMLVSALAFGGPLGAGIEIVKMTVKAFTELTAEEAKAKAELKELADGAVEYGKKMKEHVEDVLAGLRGETQAENLARKEVLPLLKQEEEAHARIAAAKSNRQIAEGQVAIDEMQAFARNAAIAQAEEEQKKAEGELAAIQAKIVTARSAVGEVGGGERAKDEEKAAEEATKLRDQQAIDEAKSRADQLHEWKKHYDERTAFATKAVEDIFAAQEKEALEEAKLQADQVHEYKKHYDQVTAETTRKLKEDFDIQDAAAKKVADEHLRLQKHLEKISVDGARNIAASFGGAFASMVAGAQSVDAAFVSMAKSGIKAVIDMALKSIEAYVLSAEAAAAFSQAGIPVIGPALAMAAAAAMGAFISGLADQLPSAAVGADIPTMSNPIVQLHGGESVLTHPTTDKLNAFLDGAGGPSEELHVHIHGAIDGDSVRRVVNSDHFVRALRDARRTGRMP